MTLTINYEFRKQIQGYNASLNYCYQCATCTGICPVAQLTNVIAINVLRVQAFVP